MIFEKYCLKIRAKSSRLIESFPFETFPFEVLTLASISCMNITVFSRDRMYEYFNQYHFTFTIQFHTDNIRR